MEEPPTLAGGGVVAFVELVHQVVAGLAFDLLGIAQEQNGRAAAITWQVQDWRYGQQLEHHARLQAETLNQLTLAAATQPPSNAPSKTNAWRSSSDCQPANKPITEP